MPKTIFVNLPVADLAASTAFYKALGFSKNDAFSDDRASATGWCDAIHVMLMTHDSCRTLPTSRRAQMVSFIPTPARPPRTIAATKRTGS